MRHRLTLALFLVPALLVAGEKSTPVGRKVDNFTLRDYRGAERSLQEFAGSKLVVVAFTGTECPLAKAYGPRLAELAKTYEPRGVTFLAVNSNQQDAVSAIGQYAKQSGITFPILKDVGNVLADRMGAARTPEVFVLDADRVVRYHGRIDDQYGIGFTRLKPQRRDLAQALDELLAGKPVSIASTETPGCFIGRVQPTPKAGDVTYARHVAPVLQKRCVECHRPGEIGPFSLQTYEEVVGWTETIREVVSEGRMPPWHADPKYGKFKNDASLSEADKKLVLDWINNGAPMGDPRDLPKPAEFVAGWRIPKPDLVVSMPKPFTVPASGTVPYQFFVIDPGLTEDKWVKAVEVRPGCRPVVHHILVFVQPPGSAGVDRARGGFISNWLAASVPGAHPMIFPDGMAKFIPAGSRLLLQMHYTPNGAPQHDQSSIGLVFADPKTVKKEVTTDMAVNRSFAIPPNTPNYKIEATRVFNEETLFFTMMPHTHLRGKTFRYELLYPDGAQETILDLPRYDFNWQNAYLLAEPKVLPKGTKLHCVATFDNSRDNPANPNPDAYVRWGEQTWEEMMIGYFDTAPAKQDLQAHPRAVSQAPAKLPPLDPALAALAAKALESQQAFDAFAAAVKKAVPKVDRVCVTTYDNGDLTVVRAAYPGAVEVRFAETGFRGPGKAFALSAFALMNQYRSIPDLKKAAMGLDLKAMSNALSASVHVPVALDGRPGTVNFWSKEASAFPAEAQLLFRALAAAVK